jgi:hypothetical protein
VGDTEFLIDEVVDKFRFILESERISALGKKPSSGRPLLLGITTASPSTDSFISAASFQETTARPHRGGHQRKGRLPARPEGERHHGPPDPERHRDEYCRRVKIAEEIISGRPRASRGPTRRRYLVEPEHIKGVGARFKASGL